MSALAPAWAMAAQALNARDDVHLRQGVHLRVMTSPVLGIPVTPFHVGEAALGDAPTRTDIVWTDATAQRRLLTAPFVVLPSSPVTGWLPPPATATCCWIEVEAAFGSDFSVSAMVSTSRGLQPVATRSSRPYAVWASAIEQLRIEGSGTITGVRWLPSALDVERPLRLMALPVSAPHPRYAALARGVALAAARATRGAPKRRALYDVEGAPAPGSSPTLAVLEEVGRVGSLADELQPDLLRLVDERVTDPWLLSTVNALRDEGGTTDMGTSTTNCLDAVMAGTIDHGLARWLGFLDVDVLAGNDDRDLAARVVTAAFAPNWDELLARGLLLSIPPDAVVPDLAALQAAYPDLESLADLEGTVDGPFLDLGVLAAYSPLRSLDAPVAPTMKAVSDRPVRTSDVDPGPLSAWLPRVPPGAARATVVTVSGLSAGAAVAMARDDLAGAGPIVLDPPSAGAGFNQPLVPAVTADGAAQGTLSDRSCRAGAARYHVAQVDWFGRWSDWAPIDLPAGVRPAPPVPVVRPSVTQASVPDRPSDAALAGTINATIPVPAPVELPPGANLLTLLRFQVTDATGHTTTTNQPIVDPATPPAQLTITSPAPALAPCTSTTVSVSAHWVDSSGARSAPSNPIALTIWDPRPPAPVIVDASLRYASRPDVTGRSTVPVTWSASSPQERFRVYYADETTAQTRLERAVVNGDDADGGKAELLTALLDADILARSEAWTERRAAVPRDAFSLITPSPVERTGHTTTVEHVVSGSQRTLALYRVVAVSGANVDADFATSALIPYAVPNTLPPPQPALAVRIGDASTNGTAKAAAELTVTVPRGSRRATEYRLRRSRVSSADALLMPIVTVGSLHPPTDDGPHVEVLTDNGPTLIEPDGVLGPWDLYTWRIEVRGGPEPGGGPPGAWSQPSPAVGAPVVPLDGPPPPTIRPLRVVGASVHIDVVVPSDLRGGVLGSYTVELYRQIPGENRRLFATITEQHRPGGNAPWPFVDDVAAAVAGTTYCAVIIDPSGRRSDPSNTRRR